MTEPEFVPFPKIARLSRNIIVTEKIDGTNAQVWIDDLGQEMRVGSRNRWLDTKTDNAGFHRWVTEHKEELLKLGPGAHFGEWWGSGVQRGYGLTKGEKRFSLFNTRRWADGGKEIRPTCCHVVPVLWSGNFNDFDPSKILADLAGGGSLASPGFMDPEGIVIFHEASRQLFKKTIKDDEKPKGSTEIG